MGRDMMYCIYCIVGENMLILTLPCRVLKLSSALGLQFRRCEHYFLMWPRRWLRKGYVDNKVVKKETEVGQKRKEHYTKRIHLKFSLCWLLNTVLSCESSPELGCQSATSQSEQQKMSRQRKPFEPFFFRSEKIWHTHTHKDDNKKPLLLFETFRGNLNKPLISNASHQTSQVTISLWSLVSILRTKCTSVSHAKPLRSSVLFGSEFLHVRV